MKTFQHLLFFEELIRKQSDTTFKVFLCLKFKGKVKNNVILHIALYTREPPHQTPKRVLSATGYQWASEQCSRPTVYLATCVGVFALFNS